MQIVSTYVRNLKTSRDFVLENIMDLDHVCSLHRKWFRNLRIRSRRPDYVEYRLTSLFYGLRQEILVKGAPIDRDHYWYEFNGALARIRVDGSMTGPDGDLTLSETITYAFAWPLAPVFWFLRPLFQRQKQDILLADSQLLERVYELDRQFFQRREDSALRVVVYGGSGFFGRLVVEDLLRHSQAHIVIASRRAIPVDFGSQQNRVTIFESDANDRDSVLTTIDGAAIVVCCSGPYQGHTLNLLLACIEKKVHYVDVADDRDFVVRCYEHRAEIEKAGIMAFVGCSVVPGISSLLTGFCREQIPQIAKTRIFITPGTRHPRGAASFRCLLSTIGKEFLVPRPDGPKKVLGWTEREEVNFPPPLDRRWAYSVVDIADYFVQPRYFGTRTVEFKIGAELDFLNRSLSFVGWLKRLLRASNVDWLVPIARPFILFCSLFGTSRGAVMVHASDGQANPVTAWWAAFREERGEIIPAILPSIAAQMILNRGLRFSGLAPLPDWLSRERFIEEMTKRQVKLATKSNGDSWTGINY
jgi:hypothetical protein